MPKETPRPRNLIHSHEIMKFRIFTSLNKRRIGTIPKKVSITAKATGNRLSTNTAQKKDVSRSCKVPTLSREDHNEPLPEYKVRGNFVPPSIKNRRVYDAEQAQLDYSKQAAKGASSQACTSNKEMNRTMPRAPFPNHVQHDEPDQPQKAD